LELPFSSPPISNSEPKQNIRKIFTPPPDPLPYLLRSYLNNVEALFLYLYLILFLYLFLFLASKGLGRSLAWSFEAPCNAPLNPNVFATMSVISYLFFVKFRYTYIDIHQYAHAKGGHAKMAAAILTAIGFWLLGIIFSIFIAYLLSK